MADKGFLIDLNKCVGCHACTVACKSENNNCGTWNNIPDHMSFNKVTTKESVDDSRYPYPNFERYFVPMACMHCEKPACVAACPGETKDAQGRKAVYKRPEDGIVVVDQSRCTGCKNCYYACTYGNMQFDKDNNVAAKCTLCMHRKEANADYTPACVDTCIAKARTFGDLAALEAENPDAITIKPFFGPGILYIPIGTTPLETGGMGRNGGR